MYTGKPTLVKIENNPTTHFVGWRFGFKVRNIKAQKSIKEICEQPLIIATIKTFPNILIA